VPTYGIVVAGIINPCHVHPGYAQATTDTLGAISVSKYITKTFTIQEIRPRVKKFIGINNILIIGRTNTMRAARIPPAIRMLTQLPFTTNAGINSLMIQIATM
jgi:hypothetical protein